MRRKRGVLDSPPTKKKPLPFFRAYNFEISADLLPSPPPPPPLSVGGRLRRWAAAGEKRISRDRGSLSFRSLGPASDERNVQRVSYS